MVKFQKHVVFYLPSRVSSAFRRSKFVPVTRNISYHASNRFFLSELDISNCDNVERTILETVSIVKGAPGSFAMQFQMQDLTLQDLGAMFEFHWH